MKLIDSMKAAAEHLQQATELARDWRVREAVADAGTMVQCALFVQQKILEGQLPIQHRPANHPVARRD